MVVCCEGMTVAWSSLQPKRRTIKQRRQPGGEERAQVRYQGLRPDFARDFESSRGQCQLPSSSALLSSVLSTLISHVHHAVTLFARSASWWRLEGWCAGVLAMCDE